MICSISSFAFKTQLLILSHQYCAHFRAYTFSFPVGPSVCGDTVLVTTPARSYTASDYRQLFSDIGLTDGFAMYQGIENINEVTMGDGDGAVNLLSSKVCLRWANSNYCEQLWSPYGCHSHDTSSQSVPSHRHSNPSFAAPLCG